MESIILIIIILVCVFFLFLLSTRRDQIDEYVDKIYVPPRQPNFFQYNWPYSSSSGYSGILGYGLYNGSDTY